MVPARCWARARPACAEPAAAAAVPHRAPSCGGAGWAGQPTRPVRPHSARAPARPRPPAPRLGAAPRTRPPAHPPDAPAAPPAAQQAHWSAPADCGAGTAGARACPPRWACKALTWPRIARSESAAMASSQASIRPVKVTYAPCISASACSADVTASSVCSSCSSSCRLSSDRCRSAWRVAYGSASRASMAGRTDCKRSAKASVLSTSARSSSTMLTTSSRIFAARSSASLRSVRKAASSARSAS